MSALAVSVMAARLDNWPYLEPGALDKLLKFMIDPGHRWIAGDPFR
jgi:hypothetical protein